MSLSLVHSRRCWAWRRAAVTVEVHLANGLPSFTLVGLADIEVKEARERVRSALQKRAWNSRTTNASPSIWRRPTCPRTRAASICRSRWAFWRPAARSTRPGWRVTNLPASCRCRRTARRARCAGHEPGVAASRVRDAQLVLPAAAREEAALVPGAQVYRAQHLLDVVQHFLPRRRSGGRRAGQAGAASARPRSAAAALPRHGRRQGPIGRQAGAGDCRRRRPQPVVDGPAGHRQVDAGAAFCRAVAAHDDDEALAKCRLASLGGRFALDQWAQRPTCHPHHTASAVALVGGGSPPRPGEISLAHDGVLFLDELPEFPRAALEALREPLETGRITISRAARRADFPARFQLIAAMNPCPCGYLGASAKEPAAARPTRWRATRASSVGPLLDRIDLHVEVPAVDSR